MSLLVSISGTSCRNWYWNRSLLRVTERTNFPKQPERRKLGVKFPQLPEVYYVLLLMSCDDQVYCFNFSFVSLGYFLPQSEWTYEFSGRGGGVLGTSWGISRTHLSIAFKY